MRNFVLAGFAALALSGCMSSVAADDMSGAALGPPQRSDDIMGGGKYLKPWVDAALKEAVNYPLGSANNPVRADGPNGQRAYLMRLRCADGKGPTFARVGNLGGGVYGSIVDGYVVRCAGSLPAESQVIMDMYFPGYRETQTVPGFTIVAP